MLSATLRMLATQVELTTAPMRDELTEYTVTVSPTVEDLAGNPMDPDANAATFAGILRSGPIDGDITPPRVSNVGALANDSVLVTFSEPVQTEGAENPAHYRIVDAHALTRSDVDTLTATVTVLDAQLDESRTVVVLTTMSMSDIEYVISVTNVKDLAGNQIAPPERGVPYPSELRFFGIPPSGAMIDSDCDGVPDAVELRGWTVTVTTVDGNVEQRTVTSDPGDPTLPCDDPVNVAARDTNQDGVGDYEKWLHRLDPRSSDTDGDGLSDFEELHVYLTNPLHPDAPARFVRTAAPPEVTSGGAAMHRLGAAHPHRAGSVCWARTHVSATDATGDDGVGDEAELRTPVGGRGFETRLDAELANDVIPRIAYVGQAMGFEQGTTITLGDTSSTEVLVIGVDQTRRISSGPVPAGCRLSKGGPAMCVTRKRKCA